MPRINNLTFQDFVNAANSARNDDRNIKLGGSTGVKNVSWTTWKSTGVSAMNAMIQAIRNEYGDALANSCAATLNHAGNPRPLTARMVKEIKALVDVGNCKLQAQRFVSGSGPNSLRWKVYQFFAQIPKDHPIFQQFNPDQLWHMEEYIIQRRSVSIMSRVANNPRCAGEGLFNDLTEIQGLTRSISNAVERLNNAGITISDNVLRLVFHHGGEYNEDSLAEQIMTLVDIEKANPHVFDSPLNGYNEMCARLGKNPIPEGVMNDEALLYGTTNMLAAMRELNKQFAAQANVGFTPKNFGLAQGNLTFANRADNPEVRMVVEAFKQVSAELPEVAALLGGVLDSDEKFFNALALPHLNAMMMPILDEIKSSTRLMDAAVVKDIVRAQANHYAAREKICDELLAIHDEALTANNESRVTNATQVRMSYDALIAKRPDDLAILCSTTATPEERQAAMARIKGEVNQSLERTVMRTQVAREGRDQIISALVEALPDMEEGEIRQLFKETAYRTRVSYIDKESREEFTAAVNAVATKVKNNKLALLQNLNALKASANLPQSLFKELQRQILTNPDYKYDDMPLRAYELARGVDVSPLLSLRADSSAQEIRDALFYVGMQINRSKTNAEKDYEPFERQTLTDDIMLHLAVLNPEAVKAVAQLESSDAVMDLQELLSINDAAERVDALNKRGNATEVELRAAQLEYQSIHDASTVFAAMCSFDSNLRAVPNASTLDSFLGSERFAKLVDSSKHLDESVEAATARYRERLAAYAHEATNAITNDMLVAAMTE